MTEIWRLPRLAQLSAARSIMAVLRDTDGIAVLEFGMLSPLMIYTLLVAADIAHGLEISRRMTVAANTIAQLTSQVSTTSGTVTDPELTVIFDSIVATFPDVMADAASRQINWQSDIQPIVTEVVFSCAVDPDINAAPPVAPNCGTATAVWSAGFNNGGGFPHLHRTCGTLPLDNTSTDNPSLTTLPAGLAAPGSVIVVDLFYHFTPSYTKWLTGTVTFQRTAYLAPRFFYQLGYDTTTGVTSPYASCGSTVVSS